MGQAPLRPEIRLPVVNCTTDSASDCRTLFDFSDATSFTFSSVSNSVNSWAQISFPEPMYVRQLRVWGQQGITDLRLDLPLGMASQTVSGISTAFFKTFELNPPVNTSLIRFTVVGSSTVGILKDIEVLGAPLEPEVPLVSCTSLSNNTCAYALDGNSSTSWVSTPALNADLTVQFSGPFNSFIQYVSIQTAAGYPSVASFRLDFSLGDSLTLTCTANQPGASQTFSLGGITASWAKFTLLSVQGATAATSTSGLTSIKFFGAAGTNCPAGYYCTNTTSTICPIGSYCPAGTTAPIPCPLGYFGNTTGLSTSTCSGQCLTGTRALLGATSAICNGFCPAGSYCPWNTTSVITCPIGSFCPNASAVPVPCPLGTYGSAVGLSSASCSGQCLARFYGNTTGQTSPTCSGPCSSGYICPVGTGQPTPCPAGFFCPANGAPQPCQPGYYCPLLSTFMTACPVGTYGATSQLPSSSCSGLCFGGYFGSGLARTFPTCDGACSPGYFCPNGSTSATQQICPLGYYCPPASSAAQLCPNGTYTFSLGLSSCENIVASVSSVTSVQGDGSYPLNSVINVTVAFVNVRYVLVPLGSVPTLSLDAGGYTRQAVYVAGSGSLLLTFQYTVSNHDYSPRLAYVSSGSLTGIVYGPALNYPVSLTLPAPTATNSLYANRNIVVAARPDNTSTFTCSSSVVPLSGSISCVSYPRFRGVNYAFASTSLTLSMSAPYGSFSGFNASQGSALAFTFTAATTLGTITISDGNSITPFTINIYRVIDQTTSLSCTPLTVTTGSTVTCTITPRLANTVVATHSIIFTPRATRNPPVTFTGGDGVLSAVTPQLASSFTFTYQVPSHGGPIQLWDGYSGNTVTISVYDTPDPSSISYIGESCL
eukprot:TRINITY_DN880_c0_g1_i2.p1 TRINITY_DN880_c0_g1~~TRINITY_DN880_c0_g1_i2.p1  ORF type:complete len:891 (+),score=349.38 TRINITY_DN880_c0_g1_i2:33-2675(+)